MTNLLIPILYGDLEVEGEYEADGTLVAVYVDTAAILDEMVRSGQAEREYVEHQACKREAARERVE